jgi:predicted transcriptional regulator of viral defense system
VDVRTLKQKTGFDEKQIRNIIYKAHKQGVIERVGRGIYIGGQE